MFGNDLNGPTTIDFCGVHVLKLKPQRSLKKENYRDALRNSVFILCTFLESITRHLFKST